MEKYYKILSGNGWLSPDGVYYPCKFQEHLKSAEDICSIFFSSNIEKDKESLLEKCGWVKVSAGEVYFIVFPNQTQKNLIFDWYTEQKKELPRFFKFTSEELS